MDADDYAAAWLFRDDPRVVEGAIDKPLQDAAIKQQMWRIVPLIHGSLLMRRATDMALAFRYSPSTAVKQLVRLGLSR